MHLISLCIFHEIHAQKTAKCRAKILSCSIDNSTFFRYHIYIKKERQGKLYEKKNSQPGFSGSPGFVTAARHRLRRNHRLRRLW